MSMILLAGCSKIHEQRTFTVDPGGLHSLQISAPLSEQTVQVAVTSDQPVNVWVVLEKNIPQGKDDYDPETITEGVLAKEKNIKDATLTAKIPGKEKYRVLVGSAAKTANVTVKIDSQ
jgi:hypothetical protein